MNICDFSHDGVSSVSHGSSWELILASHHFYYYILYHGTRLGVLELNFKVLAARPRSLIKAAGLSPVWSAASSRSCCQSSDWALSSVNRRRGDARQFDSKLSWIQKNNSRKNPFPVLDWTVRWSQSLRDTLPPATVKYDITVLYIIEAKWEISSLFAPRGQIPTWYRLTWWHTESQ